MSRHTALLALPDLLRKAGLNVIVAEDWDLGQGAYFWTDPDTGRKAYDEKPSSYMIHHTAGASYPMKAHNLMPANALVGLYRGGDRLYADGDGVATVYLASSGPARISSGYGYKPAAWDYTFKDRRAPTFAQGPDTGTALNRYAFNVETVHPGLGGPLNRDVWMALVTMGVVLHDLFDWKDRTLGHASWTTRKVDPRWSVGLPHDGRSCIVDIQDAIEDGIPDLPEYPDLGGEYMFPMIRRGDGYRSGDHPEYRPAVKACQIMLAHQGFSDAESVDDECLSDGAFGPGTETSVKDFQRARGLTVDGIVGPKTWTELNK